MRRSLLLILLLFSSAAALAQRGNFHVWEDHTRNATATQALEAYRQGKFRPLAPSYLNPGFTESVYWVALGAIPQPKELILVADNAHVNHLEWYAVKDSAAALLAVTGDFHPFYQRPLIHNTFAFPLEPRAPLYLLKVDKAFESLQAPLKLVTMQELQDIRTGEALMNGILTGTILLIILFGIFLFATTREMVYGWYALYVFCMLGWIWANRGLGFHYLWPDSVYFASRSRLTFATASLIVSVQFLSAFIGLDPKGRNRKILWGFQFIWAVTLALILWPMDYTVFERYSMLLQSTIPVFTLIGVFFIIGALIQKIRKGNMPALLYLAGTTVLLAFVAAESLYHLGKVKLPEFFSHFGVFTGVVLEMIIITFGLAARFNTYRKEKEAVLLQMNEQQKALTDTIITVEAAQRKQLADTLHDEIGSMLSLASLNLGAAKNEPAIEQTRGLLMTVSHTIRNISHQLTPVAIEKYGLLHAISDMVQIANASGKMKIELILVGFKNELSYPSNYQHTIYRIIQELLQNIIKHAGASNVLIQLVELEDSCTIITEDNGRGIDLAAMGPDFLRSVRSKVEYLQGRMNIDSQLQQGTMTNIEIPLPGKTLTELY
ncbi:sensor histidine kinase [Chitinophaga cymbidii]|uniref:sensor histidine kinase n=1 Tax=Chitinophaga cymbidii TaxID=1096750 RepID=UPI00164C5265|nr:7TM diverse intracellular signaling domain-containing protein [Chitinophaga cymbidii]